MQFEPDNDLQILFWTKFRSLPLCYSLLFNSQMTSLSPAFKSKEQYSGFIPNEAQGQTNMQGHAVLSFRQRSGLNKIHSGANSLKDCTAVAAAKPAQMRQKRNRVIHKSTARGEMHPKLRCQANIVSVLLCYMHAGWWDNMHRLHLALNWTFYANEPQCKNSPMKKDRH